MAERFMQTVLTPSVLAAQDHYFGRHITVDSAPERDPLTDDERIFIEARRNIRAGEELLYDYQYERTDDHTEEDEALYACRCGAASCRGSILATRKSGN